MQARPATHMLFQSTRPRKSATVTTGLGTGLDKFQSTRPRKSATFSNFVNNVIYWVSIHAPPKERDTPIMGSVAELYGFNPRAPERARLPYI